MCWLNPGDYGVSPCRSGSVQQRTQSHCESLHLFVRHLWNNQGELRLKQSSNQHQQHNSNVWTFFGMHGRWGWGSEESGSNRHVLYNHFSILVAALTPWDVLRSNATSKVSEHFVLYSMVWTTFLSRGRADWVIWQLPFYIDLCILPLWLAALNFRSDGAYPQHSFLFRKRWGL